MSTNKKTAVTLMQTMLIMGIVFLVLFVLIAVPFYKSLKQKQAITSYRRIYSALLQANKVYSLVNAENMNQYNTKLPLNKFAERYFTPYLSINSYCKGDQSACWNSPQYRDLNNKKMYNISLYSIVLEDKTVIGFHKNSQGLISLIVDINGRAGENKLGKDIFVFYIYNNDLKSKICPPEKYEGKVIPDGLHLGGYDECGIPHDVYGYMDLFNRDLFESCNKKAASNDLGLGAGAACGALISKSGWVIDKIYPW